MSVFKNLKSLFIIEEEGVNKTTPEQKQKPLAEKQATIKQQSTPPQTSNQPQNIRQSGGRVEERFTDILLKAIEENDLEGFDYLEFKKALKGMGQMDMDEATRFKSAFIMAQTMGVTAAKLIDSGNFYVDILKKEEAKFLHALEQQQQKNIGHRKNQLEQTRQGIATKQAQIKKLQEEIKQSEVKADELEKDLAEVTQKIATAKNNFEASYHVLKSQLEADIQKISKYLQ